MEHIVIKSLDRINLLGEHVDYNDGLVLPAAIDKCIYMTLKTNGTENRCTVKSKGLYQKLVILDLNFH
ncbi:Galactokinase [Croceitalea dokdonensis DOKDO 023]|uniref:Galactokinase n=1 Tax=Croceitalea dokdonensis DOKDO 023 TaxID=1300341 RepID=A0A0P7AIB8_9FLAO|nr:galactokinase family protein [Croceitalea dokdonensis]KPM31503.1 Galactokinase [Croceitalea dokdonensis DOKDO 023]